MAEIIIVQEYCDDPTHLHHSPIQNLIGFEQNGHWVDVTQDGDVFHVRIDEDDATVRAELNDDDAMQYIQQMTEVRDV